MDHLLVCGQDDHVFNHAVTVLLPNLEPVNTDLRCGDGGYGGCPDCVVHPFLGIEWRTRGVLATVRHSCARPCPRCVETNFRTFWRSNTLGEPHLTRIGSYYSSSGVRATPDRDGTEIVAV